MGEAMGVDMGLAVGELLLFSFAGLLRFRLRALVTVAPELVSVQNLSRVVSSGVHAPMNTWVAT